MRKTIIIAAFLALVLIGLTHSYVSRTGAQDPSQRPSNKNDLPIADLGAPEPNDTKQQALRRVRSSRHDIADKSVDAKRFELNDNSVSVLLSLPSSHAQKEPPFPVIQSDAIVVGEVVDTKAYLSNDRTSVYSEFTVVVHETIKASRLLPVGSSIAVERPGGRVLLRSGKELTRGAPYGRGMPQKGVRYVLFLAEDQEAGDFALITGYEVRSGQVFPLDHTPGDQLPSAQFAEYEKYSGVNESFFFAQLQLAISQAATAKSIQ